MMIGVRLENQLHNIRSLLLLQKRSKLC